MATIERRQNYPLESYNLTAEELAAKLQYDVQRVRALANEGKLPALKRFRRWMFNEQEVLATLKNLNHNNTTVAVDESGSQASDLLR